MKNEFNAIEYIKTQTQNIVSVTTTSVLGFASIFLITLIFYFNSLSDSKDLSDTLEVSKLLNGSSYDAEIAKSSINKYFKDHKPEHINEYKKYAQDILTKIYKIEELVQGSGTHYSDIILTRTNKMQISIRGHRETLLAEINLNQLGPGATQKAEKFLSQFLTNNSAAMNLALERISMINNDLKNKINLLNFMLEVLSAALVAAVGILGLRVLKQYRQIIK